MALSASEEGQIRDFLGKVATSSWVGTPLLGGLPGWPRRVSLPTAAAELRGITVLIPGVAGVADAAWICEKSAADTYAWHELDDMATQALINATALGGQLGGTVASATVNASHSGSAHSQILRYSSTAEVTTTSTVAVDLWTSGTLAIPVTSGIIIEGVYRKTAGAAVNAYLGLKLNATIVNEASFAIGIAGTGAGNQAEAGLFRVEIGPRSANYLYNVGLLFWGTQGSGQLAGTPGGATFGGTNPAPNATITAIALRGISGNAAVTLAVKEVAIYEVLYQ